MRLKESRLASADLDAVFDFGAETFGIEAALDYVEQIKMRYEQILVHPHSGPANEDLGAGIRSMSHRSHRIYYRMEGEMIMIVRILHKSRDARAWLD